MLTAQRRQQILALVQQHGVVHVPDLSQRFGVSPSTIRRDLEWLADRGQVRRTYGGAVAPEPLSTQERTPDSVSQRIAQTAAGLIGDGETVFIGPGPLCRALAHHLTSRRDLTVVTNSLEVAWALHQEGQGTLVVTGGSVLEPGGVLIGHLTQQALELLRADRLVIEAAGISPLDGLTSDQLPVADVLRPLLGRVGQVMVLVTADRLGKTGAVWLGPVSEADVVVTNREAASALLWDLSETGVKVTLA